jgi:hypothetical protein
MFYPCFFRIAKKEEKNNSVDKLVLNRSGIINTKTNGNLIQRLKIACGGRPDQILAFSRKLLEKIYELGEFFATILPKIYKNNNYSLNFLQKRQNLTDV